MAKGGMNRTFFFEGGFERREMEREGKWGKKSVRREKRRESEMENGLFHLMQGGSGG